MKVCQIVEAGGGVSKHLIKLAKHINTEDIEQVFIVSSIREDGLIEFLKLNGNRYIVIDMVRNINVFSDIKSLIKIVNYLKKNRFDVIHCHSSKAGFIGRLAAEISGVPVKIYSPHAFPFNDYIPKYKKYMYLLLEKFAGLFTTTIIASSETEYSDAIQNKIVGSKKLCLIHNGIELETYNNKDENKIEFMESIRMNNIDKNAKVIGFISRLVAQKDPSTFIKALKNIEAENYIVLMCGDGELTDDVKNEVKTLGLQDKVFFLGYRNDLYKIINAIDIFVLPSLWEGLPYVLLETMFFGKAVIVSDVVGNKDVVKDNYNGLLFNPKDYIKLAQIIDSLLSNEKKIEILGRNAKEDIMNNYDVKSMINEYSQLYFNLYKNVKNIKKDYK